MIKYILIFSQIIAVASCAVADPQIQAPQQDEVIAAKQQINAHKTVKNTDQIVAASNIQPVIDTKQNPELHNQTELTSDLNKKITTNKKSVISEDTSSKISHLKPYVAEYEATWKAGWFPITIEATRTLEKIGDNWKVSFEAYSSVADLSEISEFTLLEDQILPITYRYKTSGFLSKKLRKLEFNRDKNKVWLPYKETWGNYELTNSIKDHLSYQEQIRLDLINGKTELSYAVAYKGRLKQYEFSVVGETSLKTTQGNMRAIEIKQNKSKDTESTHIWLAKDYDYLIIKLQTTKSNGVSQTLKLKQAKIGNKKISGL